MYLEFEKKHSGSMTVSRCNWKAPEPLKKKTVRWDNPLCQPCKGTFFSF